MQQDLHDLRKSYDKSELLENTVSENPLELFGTWFNEAKNCKEIVEANTMSISTIGQDGFPKSRIVLLKEVEDNAFVFYTNYTSEKATAISENHNICLHFFWPELERQVIVKAIAGKISRERSLSYFKSRPRGSQIGAWASDQSSVVLSREYLNEQIQYYENKFKDQDIPLPDHWGGFECKPLSLEFWQGRPNRMHDRLIYTNNDNNFTLKRLAP